MGAGGRRGQRKGYGAIVAGNGRAKATRGELGAAFAEGEAATATPADGLRTGAIAAQGRSGLHAVDGIRALWVLVGWLGNPGEVEASP